MVQFRKYEVTYLNNGFTQTKYMCTEPEYLDIKRIVNSISDEKDKPKDKRDLNLIKNLSKELYSMTGGVDVNYELICEGGLHHQSMSTGYIRERFKGDVKHYVKWA